VLAAISLTGQGHPCFFKIQISQLDSVSVSVVAQQIMKRKGSSLYTILPIRMAMENYHQRQLRQQDLATERRLSLSGM